MDPRRLPGSRATLGRRWGPPLVPVAPLWLPFGVLLTLDLKISGIEEEFFRRLHVAKTRQREEELR